MALKNGFKFSAEIKKVKNDTTCLNVSSQTVTRRLQEVNLFTRSSQRKPLVSLKNKKKQLEFANKHVIWPYKN